jgi:hypothetical protein
MKKHRQLSVLILLTFCHPDIPLAVHIQPLPILLSEYNITLNLTLPETRNIVLVWFVDLFYNNFKVTACCSGRAYKFTLGTPLITRLTPFIFNNNYTIVNKSKNPARTRVNAQSTFITFICVD